MINKFPLAAIASVQSTPQCSLSPSLSTLAGPQSEEDLRAGGLDRYDTTYCSLYNSTDAYMVQFLGAVFSLYSPSARPADMRGGEPGAEEEKLDDEDAAHVETPHTDEEIVLPSADSTICCPSSA